MNKKENIKKGSSPRAVVGDLPLIKSLYKKMFSLFKTARSVEDSRQRHSGMTLIYEQHAFTLIELLVVVLIIGILAAIALPQYEVAVRRARTAEVLIWMRALKNAQEVYYLANGHYATDADELDVTIPPGVINMSKETRVNGKPWYYVDSEYVQGAFDLPHSAPRLMYYYDHITDERAGKMTCYTLTAQQRTKQVCLSLGGVEYPRDTEGYSYYDVPL